MVKIFISIVIFVVSFFLIGQNLSKPFYGIHDWNGARYGNIARNYLKYGPLNLNFGQIENSGDLYGQKLKYFTHYPQVLPLLIYLSYLIFGISEFSTRLVPVISTSFLIVLIFLVGSKIKSIQLGVFASLLALSTPLVLYFGKNPVHEPLVVMFSLAACYFYLHFEEKRQRKYLILFALFLVLAELTTWAGYFLVPALTLNSFITNGTRGLKKLLPFWVISVLVFSVYLAYTRFLTGEWFGGGLSEAFFQRSALSPEGKLENLNALNYLLRLKIWIATLYTYTLSALVLVWAISKKFSKFSRADYFILTLLIFGIIYPAVFINASYIHNYLVFYLLPFMSLAGGAGLCFLIEQKLFKKLGYIIALIVISVVFVEKYQFQKALQQSSPDRFAVEVGKYIKSNFPRESKVQITPASFGFGADNFLKFYSDTQLIYSDDTSSQISVKIRINGASNSYQLVQ